MSDPKQAMGAVPGMEVEAGICGVGLEQEVYHSRGWRDNQKAPKYELNSDRKLNSGDRNSFLGRPRIMLAALGLVAK